METKILYTAMREQLRLYQESANNAMTDYLRSYPRYEVDVDERVYVELASREYDGAHSQPLTEFIGELQEIAEGAPAGADVRITLSAYAWSDESSADPKWEVGYWRDPTPEERREREEENASVRAHNAALEQRKADSERGEYERLKTKYGTEM